MHTVQAEKPCPDCPASEAKCPRCDGFGVIRYEMELPRLPSLELAVRLDGFRGQPPEVLRAAANRYRQEALTAEYSGQHGEAAGMRAVANVLENKPLHPKTVMLMEPAKRYAYVAARTVAMNALYGEEAAQKRMIGETMQAIGGAA